MLQNEIRTEEYRGFPECAGFGPFTSWLRRDACGEREAM